MTDEHDIMAAYYSDQDSCVLECWCGYRACGPCWEDAGAEMDLHLEDEE